MQHKVRKEVLLILHTCTIKVSDISTTGVIGTVVSIEVTLHSISWNCKVICSTIQAHVHEHNYR